MEKIKTSIIYQIIYCILIIGCIHTDVIQLTVDEGEMNLLFQLTPTLVILIGVFIVNFIHFLKLNITKLIWIPLVFTSTDEREQKMMNEAASSGFRSVFPLCVLMGAVLMFLIVIFHMFTKMLTVNEIKYVLFDLFYISFALPYFIYTISVYRKIKQV